MNRRAPGILVLFAVFFLVPEVRGQAPKIGPEFQLNTYTTNYQSYGEISSVPGGGFVVVWHSLGSDLGDGDGYSILGQRFNASGVRAGSELAINGVTGGDQRLPHVGMADDGRFVVVWQSPSSPGADADGAVVLRRFSSSATPLGEIQVNSFTTGLQNNPQIAVGASGEFVVVWKSVGSPGDDSQDTSIQGRRFDSGGTGLATQFQVNVSTPGAQFDPSIAMDTSGSFVVVWASDSSSGSDSDGSSIQGRRFNSSGGPIAGELQINNHTPTGQSYPRVDTGSDGRFIVVWTSFDSSGSDTDGFSVQARRFLSDGTPSGDDFQVNTFTTGFQWQAAMLVDDDDYFYVSWCSLGSPENDDDLSSMQARIYDPAGAAVGTEFQVNTYTTESQAYPSIAIDRRGSFVVVWDSYGSTGDDASYDAIQGQRFESPLALIFSDGFESGDMTAWSAAVP